MAWPSGSIFDKIQQKLFANPLALLGQIKNSKTNNFKKQFLSAFNKIYKSKQNTSNKITVYHRIGRDGTVESVKKNGLMTYNELQRQNLVDKAKPYSGLMPDQYDVIYFSPETKQPQNTQNLVGYAVDPDKTYVYNREYRFDVNLGSYNSSKLLLAKYLKRKKKGEQMCVNRPTGKMLVYHPRTCKPYFIDMADYDTLDKTRRMFWYVDGNRYVPDSGRHHLYLGEVIIEKDRIAPEELTFFE